MKFLVNICYVYFSLFTLINSITTAPSVLTPVVNLPSSKTSKVSSRVPLKKTDSQNPTTSNSSQESESTPNNQSETKEPSKKTNNSIVYSTFRYMKDILQRTLTASLVALISFKMITTLMKNNVTTTSSGLENASVIKNSLQARDLLVREKFSFDNLHESTKEAFKREQIFNTSYKALEKPILISGPPGCGKTILSYYCAEKSEALHIMVNLTSLGNLWIGQFAGALRDLIKTLKTMIDKHNKIVIVFDEIDTFGAVRVNLDADSSSAAQERNSKATALFLAIEELGKYMMEQTKEADTFYRLFMFTNFAGNLDPALLSRSKSIAIENPSSEEVANYLLNLTTFAGDNHEMYSRSLFGVSFRSLSSFTNDRDPNDQINNDVSQINSQFKFDLNGFEYKSLNNLSVDASSFLPQWKKSLESCHEGNITAIVGSAADCDKLMVLEGFAKEKKCNLLICYADTFSIAQLNVLQNFLTSVRSNADRSKPLMIYVASKKLQHIELLRNLCQKHNIFVFAKDFDLKPQIRIDTPTWHDRKTILSSISSSKEEAIEATYGCSFSELQQIAFNSESVDDHIARLPLKKYVKLGPSFVEIAAQKSMPNLSKFNKKWSQFLSHNPELINGKDASNYNFFKATDVFCTKINALINQREKLVQLFNEEIIPTLHPNQNTCLVFSFQKLGSNLSKIKELVSLFKEITSLFLDEGDISKFVAQVNN